MILRGSEEHHRRVDVTHIVFYQCDRPLEAFVGPLCQHELCDLRTNLPITTADVIQT